MNWDAKHRILAGLAVVALAALGTVASSWLAAHDGWVRLEATLMAQRSVIAQAEERKKQRAQELKETLEQMARLKQQTQTPQQVVKELPQYLPLPQPITIETPGPNQGAQVPQGGTPPAAHLPAEDLKPLFDFALSCRACQAKLEAAQADLADDDAKIQALAKERDAAVKAAKGGGFWKRVKTAAKWFAVGVVVGAAAAAAR